MSSTTKSTWTNTATALLAPVALARGAVSRTVLDLTGKNGAMIVACIARLGTTGLTGNVYFRVRRLQLNSARSVPASYIEYAGGNATASITAAINTSTVATGVTTFVTTATPTSIYTANANICFLGVTAITSAPTAFSTNAEWVRLANALWTATSTAGAINIDAPSAVARIASEVCSTQAEVLGPYWLEGGAQYELIFDYASATAGESIGIALYQETYDVDTTT